MRRLAPLLLLAAAGLAAAQDTPVPPEAFALVDGVAILRTEVAAEQARVGLSPAAALQRLVGAQVLRGRLVAAGQDPAALSEADVTKGLEEAQATLRKAGVPEERIAELAKFKDQLRVSVAFTKFVDAQVAAAEQQGELAAELPRLRLEVAGEVRARVLVCLTSATGGASAALERARGLLARLGPAPDDPTFAALARESSDDPLHALTGGDLDWFSPRAGRLIPEIVEACCAKTTPGLVAEPVVTPRAVLLVYVTETRFPAAATPESLRPQLLQAAKGRRTSQLLQAWLKDTPVLYAKDAPR